LKHGINANQLRRWMDVDGQLRIAEPSVALLPVTVESNGPTVAARPAGGTIDIEINGARVRLRGQVDEDSLRCVLKALRGSA